MRGEDGARGRDREQPEPAPPPGRTRAETEGGGALMTDLESFVRKDGRAELVREVRSRIKDLGITYLYYQFVSVTGRIMGKGIPADHWEAVAERGFQLVYGSTANLFVD